MFRRRGGILRWLWAYPLARVLIVLLVVGGIAWWIYEQVSEYKEGERLRERDRK